MEFVPGRAPCVRWLCRMRRVTLALIVLTGGVVAMPRSAEAQATTAEADAEDRAGRVLFDAGAEAYAAGRYDEALRNFVRAYELSGRPELHYNIALAHDRLRHDDEALASYRRYLAEAPATGPHRGEVESRVAVLERSLEERRALEARANAALTDEPPPRTPIVRRWWFWTAIGAVVATAVIVPVVVTRDRTEATSPSDFGGPVVVRFGGGS